MLSTAVVHVHDHIGNLLECKILLDSESQTNFISRLSERLKLPQDADVTIRGISATQTKAEKQVRVNVCSNVCSRFSKFQDEMLFLVVDRITGKLPAISINVNLFQIPSNI